jgi:hypothetical protein
MPLLTSEQIHSAGAERHKERWLFANQRAAEVVLGSPLHVHTTDVKVTIPRVVLKVLDGVMIDMGKRWNPELRKWVNAPAVIKP